MTEHKDGDGFIATYTGQVLNMKDPQPGQFTLADVVQGLSLNCRFAGQCKDFYSIAEHSVLTCMLTRYLLIKDGKDPRAHREELYAALFHDGHEAFYHDVPTPCKDTICTPEYYKLCDQVDAIIAEMLHFNVKHFKDPLVVRADRWALEIEGRTLMEGKNWSWWNEGYVHLPKEIPWTGNLLPLEAKNVFHAEYQRI